MTSEFNILLSSSGHRVERIDILRRTLRELGLPGDIIACDMNRHCASFTAADVSLPVPPCRDPDFIPTLLDICREYRVKLLIPNIDTELPMLAEHRQEFAAIGTTALVSTPEVIRIGNDKRRTYQWLVQNGCPTIRQAEPKEVLANLEAWPFPLVVKPVAGSASQGVLKVRDVESLRVASRQGDLIVQTMATGHEHTIDVLVNREQKCVCAVPRKRIEVRGGEVSKGVTVRHPAMQKLATRIAETLPGAFGPLNIQVFHDSDTNELAVIEINPRFAGGFPLAWQAGANFPRWIIEEILGRPTTASADAWRDGLMMLRYFEAVYIES